MIFKVEMLAFGDGQIREVGVLHPTLDDRENLLDQIYYFGQNDFQPKRCPSVSVGDIIHLDNEKHIVASLGFRKLSDEEYAEYKASPRRDRLFSKLTIGD